MAKARKSRKTPISVMPAATDIRRDEALVKLAAPPCGCDTNSPGLLPEYTSPIDGLDRLPGTLPPPGTPPALLPKIPRPDEGFGRPRGSLRATGILHGVATGRDTPIIVDQTVATGGQLRIQACKRIPCGFVQVAVQANDRKTLRLRDGGQCVAKPAFQKAHLGVEQTVPREILPYLFFRYGKLVKLIECRFSLFGGIGGVLVRVRFRYAFKGVRNPHGARGFAVSLQESAHENAGAAAPDAGFDQIAGHAALDRVGNAFLYVFEPLESNHGLRIRRPVLAGGTVFGGKSILRTERVALQPQNSLDRCHEESRQRTPPVDYLPEAFVKRSPRETPLHQVEIRPNRRVDRSIHRG